jgi:hypothetical protein
MPESGLRSLARLSSLVYSVKIEKKLEILTDSMDSERRFSKKCIRRDSLRHQKKNFAS